MNTLSDTTTIHPDIERIFNEIADCPEGHYITLEEGDPFHEPDVDVITRPVSEYHPDRTAAVRDAIEREERIPRIAVYSPTGEGVKFGKQSPEWWDELIVDANKTNLRHASTMSNAVARVGDHLVVGRGFWYPVGESVIDGVPTFTLVSRDEKFRRMQAEEGARRAEVLAQHPEIKADMPAWADRAKVNMWSVGDPEVAYAADFGDVSVSVILGSEEGVYRMTEAPTGYISDSSELTVEQMRALAADLIIAADTLDGRAHTSGTPYVDFYTADGELIPLDEHGAHNPLEGMVSFSGTQPTPAVLLSRTELETVSAWLTFLGIDSGRRAEHLRMLMDQFRGYPKGTTLGDIKSGKAQKAVQPVEEVTK